VTQVKLDIDRKAYLIDHVTALDLSMRRVIRNLYDAAAVAVDKPLCLAAAEKIAAKSRKGDTVLLTTGFPIPPKNIGETDGPPGTAVLAETLLAAGLKPIIVTDDYCMEIVKAASPKVPVSGFPIKDEEARHQAEKILSEHSPSALIAVERPGWNQKHEYHNMRGLNISSLIGKTDRLFETAHKRGVATIAVGDGGNELGCGTIMETVRKNVKYGSMCQCLCKGGIAASTPADVLVVSAISNWGAYGISACLSLLRDLRYTHDSAKELSLLNRVVEAGAIDGVTLESKPFVDGLPPSIDTLVTELIHTIANL